MIFGTWITKNPLRRISVDSRQTDEETGHDRTRKPLARRMVTHVKKLCKTKKKQCAEEKPKFDAESNVIRRATQIHLPRSWTCVISKTLNWRNRSKSAVEGWC